MIELPHKYKPRPYQRALFSAFFEDRYKRFVDIWHRRGGKDKTWWNLMVAASQERVGTYMYALPKLVQAREVIWEGIDAQGIRFLDHIPPELIDGKPNNTQMAVKLKNGSRIKLAGSDHYNTIVGSNPVGIVFSEFALQNPLAWDYLRPILRENGGWSAFIYTPRGGNHGYELYEMAKNNPKWFCNLLTIEDTSDFDGDRIITDEMIQEERNSGMSEDMIEQEYYCSFSASIRGAYFANQFRELDENEQIFDFMIDRSFPVSTYWDLGWDDSTAIWFIQKKPDQSYDCIYYYENNEMPLNHYINKVHSIREQMKIVYEAHYAPHDGANHNLATGKTLIETARDLGLYFEHVPRVKHKEYAIEATRSILPRCKFHATNCKHGIRCLREYHKDWNEKLQVYREKPVHSWESHGVDAFSYFALTQSRFNTSNPMGRIVYNRVNQGNIL